MDVKFIVSNIPEENFKNLLQAREQGILLGAGEPLNPYQTSLLNEMKVRWALTHNPDGTTVPVANPSAEDSGSLKKQTSSTTASSKAGKPPVKAPLVVDSEVRASYSHGELLGGRGGLGIRTRRIVVAGGSEAEEISGYAFRGMKCSPAFIGSYEVWVTWNVNRRPQAFSFQCYPKIIQRLS